MYLVYFVAVFLVINPICFSAVCDRRQPYVSNLRQGRTDERTDGRSTVCFHRWLFFSPLYFLLTFSVRDVSLVSNVQSISFPILFLHFPNDNGVSTRHVEGWKNRFSPEIKTPNTSCWRGAAELTGGSNIVVITSFVEKVQIVYRSSSRRHYERYQL